MTPKISAVFTGGVAVGAVLVAIAVYAYPSSGPASPAPIPWASDLPPDTSRLEAVVIADKYTHAVGDRITVRITVRNVGRAKAHNIYDMSDKKYVDSRTKSKNDLDPAGVMGIFWYDPDSVGFGKGFDLASGESKTWSRQGKLTEWAGNHGTASIKWEFGPDGRFAPEYVSDMLPYKFVPEPATLTVQVPGRFNDIWGTVCDPDREGVPTNTCNPPKAHEELGPFPTVKVILTDSTPEAKTQAETMTNETGHFSFKNVPAGSHFVRFETPDGWTPIENNVQHLVIADAPFEDLTVRLLAASLQPN